MSKRKAEVIVVSSSDEDSESELEEDELSFPSQEDPEPAEGDEEACRLVKDGWTSAGFAGIKKLLVTQLKSFLRIKGLRITGLKEELVARIHEYLTLENEDIKRIFPKVSFSKDCTGDVCQGDKVLFSHAVYPEGSYDIAMKGSLLQSIGKRTVAARVVSESYGKQRHQHTFTLEILWTEGLKPMSLMQQLQIKGRNLYRHKTMRQLWADEHERVMVLAEKHSRGDAARALKRGKKGYGKTRREVRPRPAKKQRAATTAGPSQPAAFHVPRQHPVPWAPAAPSTQNSFGGGNGSALLSDLPASPPVFPFGAGHRPSQQPPSLPVRNAPTLPVWNGLAAAAAAPARNPVATSSHSFSTQPAQGQVWRPVANSGHIGVHPGAPRAPGRHAARQASFSQPVRGRQCAQHGCSSKNAKECIGRKCGKCCKDNMCSRHRH